MLILELYLCDYDKLAALLIRVNKANVKLAKIKGFTVLIEVWTQLWINFSIFLFNNDAK